MGTEDMRRQAPNVERMRLLGAEVAPVDAGARTLKDAINEAIRDWVTNVATRTTSSAPSSARTRIRDGARLPAITRSPDDPMTRSVNHRLTRCLQNRPGLVAYVTCGDPNLEATREIVLAACRAGADVIELGVPFSDPVADGPVIQRASERALAQGTSLEDVLRLAGEVRRQTDAGLIVFSYLNPVLRFGLERFCAEAVKAGVDGALIVDLTVEEADEYRRWMAAHKLDAIFLAAPTSTDKRLKAIAEACSGFLYAVSPHRDHRSAKAVGHRRPGPGEADTQVHQIADRGGIWDFQCRAICRGRRICGRRGGGQRDCADRGAEPGEPRRKPWLNSSAR
jgi:hypothetical protein